MFKIQSTRTGASQEDQTVHQSRPEGGERSQEALTIQTSQTETVRELEEISIKSEPEEEISFHEEETIPLIPIAEITKCAQNTRSFTKTSELCDKNNSSTITNENAQKKCSFVKISKLHNEGAIINYKSLSRYKQPVDNENIQFLTRSEEQLCTLNVTPAVIHPRDKTIERWGATKSSVTECEALSKIPAIVKITMAQEESIAEIFQKLQQEEGDLKKRISELIQTKAKTFHTLQRKQRRVERLKAMVQQLESIPIIEEPSSEEEDSISILHEINKTIDTLCQPKEISSDENNSDEKKRRLKSIKNKSSWRRKEKQLRNKRKLSESDKSTRMENSRHVEEGEMRPVAPGRDSYNSQYQGNPRIHPRDQGQP